MKTLSIVLNQPLKKKSEQAFLRDCQKMRQTLLTKLPKEKVDQIIQLGQSDTRLIVRLDSHLVIRLADSIDSLEKRGEFYVNSEKCESLHDAYGQLFR